MAKKNKKQQSGHQPPSKPLGPVQPTLKEFEVKLEAALIEKAKVESEFPEDIPQPEDGDSSAENLLDSESPVINSSVLSPAVSTTELSKLIATAVKLTEEAKRNNERAKNWSARANALVESWNIKIKEIAENEHDLKTRKEALLAEEKEYQTKKEDLMKLQADAEAGFIARRTELLTGLEEEIRKYSARYLEHDRKIQEELEASEKALEEKRNKINEEKQLAEEGLRESRRTIESELRQVQWLRQDLEDEKKSWKERVEQEVTRGISEFFVELDTLRQANTDQRAKILSLEESLKSVGNRSASDMAIQIENQKKMIDSLETQLADVPDIEERNRSKKLQSKNDQLFQELEKIQQENQALHIRAGKASIGVAELESLRDQREAWKTREMGYRARLDELKSDIEEYTAKVNEKDVFPACSDMDRDEILQKIPLISKTDQINLKMFAAEIRQLVGSTGLFYRPEDIRSFIAGLAACRLHILQGISGTGKTSLPLAFSKAMQWGNDLCEVQSEWRDRNDLLGYFNTFEKKFYESDFLKALYRANTPSFRHLPFFIVLDEMNLSHPEHYFADFLSALEKRTDEKSVSLPNAPMADNGPAGLTDKGRRIPVPANVWFIGTANQDETTKDFADKTYDRSHIMEFPRHKEQFKPDLPNIPPGKISFEQMQVAFGQATLQFEGKAEECIKILDGKLRRPLENLDIGWGNRLEAQLKSYIPVLVACGGSLSEGLDAILAQKLLRKLKGRFDLSADEMVKLKAIITSVWEAESQLNTGIPEQSVGLIETELRRLGGNI